MNEMILEYALIVVFFGMFFIGILRLAKKVIGDEPLHRLDQN